MRDPDRKPAGYQVRRAGPDTGQDFRKGNRKALDLSSFRGPPVEVRRPVSMLRAGQLVRRPPGGRTKGRAIHQEGGPGPSGRGGPCGSVRKPKTRLGVKKIIRLLVKNGGASTPEEEGGRACFPFELSEETGASLPDGKPGRVPGQRIQGKTQGQVFRLVTGKPVEGGGLYEIIRRKGSQPDRIPGPKIQGKIQGQDFRRVPGSL